MRAALPPLPAGLDYCVVARVPDSLPRQQRWMLFGMLAAVSLGLAMAFAVAGAWPVLLYSVIEILSLGVAFMIIERRADDWERLTVVGDKVVIEQKQGQRHQRSEFNRCWLRVELEPGRFGKRARVTLHSGGVAVEFGGALPVAELRSMAGELRRFAKLR
ncbi:MAG: DUF2244 domain-containing protein [Betaproteobacteria bacterium]